ncbi:MAG: OmpW/AlkL family protein [Rhodoferax sp.]
MKTTFFSASVLTALALSASGSAMAQATTIQLGVANVSPNSSSSAISGPFTPVDTLSLKVQNQTTVYFSAAREIDSHWEAQLALGVPPTHDVSLVVLKPTGVPGSVAALDGATVAKVRQVAPTLFANYRFGESSSQIRPFVGLGLNYTVFSPADSTAVGDSVNGGATSIKLKNSVGLAAQVGLTAKLGGPWSVTGSWSTAQVKTTMTSNTLGIERTADISFHPSVFTIAVGYSF